MESIIIPLRPVLLFAVVLARVGGLVSFAPFWSYRATPARVRVMLALLLALVVTPVVGPHLPTPPTNFVALMVVIIGELVIGCALGFVGRVVFSALEMAAHVLSFQIGLSLAATIDPGTRAQTTALGTIAQMFGLMMLLASDGHHWMLIGTVKSFQVVGPGDWTISPALAELFIRLTADAIAVGVALAAPAIIVLFSIEFVLAVAGRAAPQLHILMLSFPLKIAAGLWLVGASLFFLPGAVRTALSQIRTGMDRVLAAL